MRKLLLSFGSVFLLITFLLSGCDQKEKSLDNDALLWKISGNGLTKPSYIFGTHHLMNVGFLDNVPGFTQALDNAEQVVGEIAAEPKALREIRITVTEGRKSASEDYKSLLSADEYNRLASSIKTVLGADTAYMLGLHPATILGIYSDFIYSSIDSSYDPTHHEPIDFYIQRIVAEKGKTAVGLEATDDQVSLLLSTESLKKQTETLICLLENSDWTKKFVTDLNSFYKEKSLSKIYALYSNSKDAPCPDFITQQFSMDRERNAKWMEKLPAIMKEKSSFVAVGALHLAGEDGLLEQLRKTGYTVEAVK